MEYPWGYNRRFNSYTNFFRKEFGSRVQKVSIDAGFTCPNRDGTKGRGGCTFCNNNAFNPSYCMPNKSISNQIVEGIEFHKKRYKTADKFLAYFQAYSNSYGDPKDLKRLYSEALKHPQVIGLVVGTRPDCINDEILDIFEDLSRSNYLIVEYGIESCYDETLKFINRGHTFEESSKAIIKTAERKIKTGGHMILGLPGETREAIINQATILSKLPLNNIKFHQLQLIKGTTMEGQYQKNPELFHFYDLEEYIDLIIDFIEKLNPSFTIERFAGEAPLEYNISPVSWGIRYDQVLRLIEKQMESRNTWQGRCF